MKRTITFFRKIAVGSRFTNGEHMWIKISESEARCTRGQRRQTFPPDEYVGI